ncbi:MAG: hypothetical protein SFW36_17045 [Leptolyngbyaceae cyanobacterium bins.59]|nr:hypothetical protein [Leptolyngbyaceae cyanobacterium bins.59]
MTADPELSERSLPGVGITSPKNSLQRPGNVGTKESQGSIADSAVHQSRIRYRDPGRLLQVGPMLNETGDHLRHFAEFVTLKAPPRGIPDSSSWVESL